MPRVLLINPNSNPAVTSRMAEAIAPLADAGVVLDCITMPEGPFGVETQEHVEMVSLPLRKRVVESDADAFVIACFSDPGLAVCREATHRPVLGIRECAVMSALMQGDRFGVVALSPASVRRHAPALRAMGVAERCAGFGPLNLSVAEAEEPEAYPRVRTVGADLVARGADTLLLGCAGMAGHRAKLADELGVPVVDPVQAAAATALGLVRLAAGAQNDAVSAAAQ